MLYSLAFLGILSGYILFLFFSLSLSIAYIISLLFFTLYSNLSLPLLITTHLASPLTHTTSSLTASKIYHFILPNHILIIHFTTLTYLNIMLEDIYHYTSSQIIIITHAVCIPVCSADNSKYSRSFLARLLDAEKLQRCVLLLILIHRE